MGMTYRDPRTGQITVVEDEKLAKILAAGGYEEVTEPAAKKEARAQYDAGQVATPVSQPTIERSGDQTQPQPKVAAPKTAKEKSTGKDE